MTWGLSKIAQCDNGGEFKSVLLVLLRGHGIKIINGNPRKPSTQGLVEQANKTIEDRLGKWMQDRKTNNWPLGLLKVVWSIDTTVHEAMSMRPYQVMFDGKMPYLDDNTWLGLQDRGTAKLVNEDGEPSDNEKSIDFQVRIERTDAGIAVPSSSALPCSQIKSGPLNRVMELPTFDFATASYPTDTPSASTRKKTKKVIRAGSSNNATVEPSKNSTVTLRIAEQSNSALATSSHQGASDENVAESSAQTAQILVDAALTSHLTDHPSDEEGGAHGDNQADDGDESEQARFTRFINSPRLSNQPPGTQIEQGIDYHVLKARKRQASWRVKLATRHSKRHDLRVFEKNNIVAVMIPKIDRPGTCDSPRVYARVIRRRCNTYELQTEHGIINRCIHIKDIAPISAPLARHINIPDNETKLSLRAVAHRSSSATHIRVSCRCKGECKGRCGCEKAAEKCTLYCHGPHGYDCGNKASEEDYNQYAMVDRVENKGKEKLKAATSSIDSELDDDADMEDEED